MYLLVSAMCTYQDPPVQLSIDSSSAYEIEEDSDGVWSIVGGKVKNIYCFEIYREKYPGALETDQILTNYLDTNQYTKKHYKKLIPASLYELLALYCE